MCPGFLTRTAPWVGGSMKIPLTRILSKSHKEEEQVACVWGGGEGREEHGPRYTC